MLKRIQHKNKHLIILISFQSHFTGKMVLSSGRAAVLHPSVLCCGYLIAAILLGTNIASSSATTRRPMARTSNTSRDSQNVSVTEADMSLELAFDVSDLNNLTINEVFQPVRPSNITGPRRPEAAVISMYFILAYRITECLSQQNVCQKQTRQKIFTQALCRFLKS